MDSLNKSLKQDDQVKCRTELPKRSWERRFKLSEWKDYIVRRKRIEMHSYIRTASFAYFVVFFYLFFILSLFPSFSSLFFSSPSSSLSLSSVFLPLISSFLLNLFLSFLLLLPSFLFSLSSPFLSSYFHFFLNFVLPFFYFLPQLSYMHLDCCFRFYHQSAAPHSKYGQLETCRLWETFARHCTRLNVLYTSEGISTIAINNIHKREIFPCCFFITLLFVTCSCYCFCAAVVTRKPARGKSYSSSLFARKCPSFMDTTVQYRVHLSPPLEPVLSQLNLKSDSFMMSY